MSGEEIFEFEATVKVRVKMSVRDEDVVKHKTTPSFRKKLARRIANTFLNPQQRQHENGFSMEPLPHAFGVEILSSEIKQSLSPELELKIIERS